MGGGFQLLVDQIKKQKINEFFKKKKVVKKNSNRDILDFSFPEVFRRQQDERESCGTGAADLYRAKSYAYVCVQSSSIDQQTGRRRQVH